MLKKVDKKELAENLLVICAIIAVVLFCYPRNSWEVLMGDDLICITGFRNDGFWGTLLNPVNFQLGKVRPVSTIVLYIYYLIGGLNYKVYYLMNRVLLIVLGCGTYSILKKMNVNVLVSFVVVMLMISSPFSSYSAWQMIGVCEILSLGCILQTMMTFYYFIKSDEAKERKKYIILSILFFSILIFNAERFMYLAAVYIFIIMIRKGVKIVDKIKYSIGIALPIVVRAIIIRLAGGASLNTGRAESGDLITTLVQYTIRGFVNLFGFSIGEQWHGGFTMIQIPNWILIISSIFLFVSLGMIFSSIEKWILNKDSDYLVLIYFFAVAMSSLFSYALVGATHGEDRFLWVSYVSLCIGIAYYFSIHKKGWQIYVLAITFSSILFMSNNYYVKSKFHVHFRYSQEMAQTCYENVLELSKERTIENVCCVKAGDYNWVFDNQSFFNYYFDDSINVYYYDTFDLIDRSVLSENTVVVYPDADYPIPYGVEASWIDDCELITN